MQVSRSAGERAAILDDRVVLADIHRAGRSDEYSGHAAQGQVIADGDHVIAGAIAESGHQPKHVGTVVQYKIRRDG